MKLILTYFSPVSCYLPPPRPQWLSEYQIIQHLNPCCCFHVRDQVLCQYNTTATLLVLCVVTIVLWPLCCDHCVVTIVLWPLFCDHCFVTIVLWPLCCDHCFVTIVLWPLCCDHCVVTIVLWPLCCDHCVVTIVLWPLCCDHCVVTIVLSEKYATQTSWY